MLKLRRGTVISGDPLIIEVAGEHRSAWADLGLVGEVREGDEVVVNVEAHDLGLGSGGFDIVHVNLTRGLEGGGTTDEHVMKLNYTSLQHPVEPLDAPYEGETGEWVGAIGAGGGPGPIEAEPDATADHRPPVLVLPLHGHLAPAAWAARVAAPGCEVGYVQTVGGALGGSFSRDVGELRAGGLLAGHVTAGAAYGGEYEAISVVGAIDAAAQRLGWDAVIVGPGPGIIGSATRYGHGGMVALASAHNALALGRPTLVSPRLSSSDPRPRHRGLSHHTTAVLDLLLAPVRVAAPELGVDRRAAAADDAATLEELRAACDGRHRLVEVGVDLSGYAASGLPVRTMGRELSDDPLFFEAALASGVALGHAAAPKGRAEASAQRTLRMEGAGPAA